MATVALTVAPRTAAERPKALADVLGLPLAFLGPRPDHGDAMWKDNLWPAPQARGVLLARRALLIGLAVVAVLELWLPFERDRREAAAVAARLADAKAMEMSLRAEREDLSGILAAAEAISGMEALSLPLLADIASSLSEDVALDRLDWREGRVEVTGRAGASGEIVARLSALPRFSSVDYLSPVTRDRSGQERFTLALTLASEGVE